MKIDGRNYYRSWPFGLWQYTPDSRLAVAFAVLIGKKRVEDLGNQDCVGLGFEREVCRLNNKDITAEVVRRHCLPGEIRSRAENMIGTLLCNLVSMCDQLEERCESLEKRVAELESSTPIKQGI